MVVSVWASWLTIGRNRKGKQNGKHSHRNAYADGGAQHHTAATGNHHAQLRLGKAGNHGHEQSRG